MLKPHGFKYKMNDGILMFLAHQVILLKRISDLPIDAIDHTPTGLLQNHI